MKQETPLQLLFINEGYGKFTDSTMTMSLVVERMKFLEFSVLTDGMSIAEKQQFFDDYYAKWNDLNA